MSVAFWFRRDRRLADNLALNTAVQDAASKGERLLGCYITSPKLAFATALQRESIRASLESLDATMASRLLVTSGDAWVEFPKLSKRFDLARVYATRAFDTQGMEEQDRVRVALQQCSVELKLLDSNYAVAPGTVAKNDGTAVKVYTPFYRRWLEVGHSSPAKFSGDSDCWRDPEGLRAFPVAVEASFNVIAGESFALRTWQRFKNRALGSYHENRNRTDLPGTSHLSHALAHGEIHPRTLLAQLGDSPGDEVFRKELVWREFYADVLHRNPHTLTEYYEPRFSKMRYNSGEVADRHLEAWKLGMTGYPIVDAAMRQLATTGWMHNRSRMIVASFLVKDLHLEWQRGAEHFERLLTDFDPASNSHGWQWTAGCGTDASPYYRIFNPTLQAVKFDPNGDYVRRYIPELRHVAGPEVHEPWLLLDGNSHGYPEPIVDHAVERDEALARLAEIKAPA